MDTSIDPRPSESIDMPEEASIDAKFAKWKEELPDGNFSDDSWESDYYHSTFAIDISTSASRHEDYNEDCRKEQAIEYYGFLAEEERRPHHSCRQWNEASIDRDYTTSIDNHHHQPNRLRTSIDTTYSILIDTKAADMDKNGKFSIGSWDDCYKEALQ